MKNIYFILLTFCILLSGVIQAQTGAFRIEGKVKGNYEGETVMVDVLKEGGFPQSYIGTVKNNTFLIEIEDCNACDTLAKIRIGDSPKEELFIWLDGKDIQVDVDNEKTTIIGTKLNDEYQQYRDTTDYYFKRLASFLSENIEGKSVFSFDSRTDEYKLMRNWGKFRYDFIKKNIQNPIGIYLFKTELINSIPLGLYKGDSAVIDIYKLADDRIKLDPTAIKWKESAEISIYQNSQKKNLLNTKIADIDVLTANGKKNKLLNIVSKSDSKYFILDFWASWCGPCIAAMPSLRGIYGKYNKKGLDIIAISIDEDTSSWRKKSKQIDMPWIDVLFDSDNMSVQDLQKAYNFQAIPYSILVDKSGKIIFFVGGEQLENILYHLLANSK
ncbi:TlpA disulfide reductase family protein [Dysgonomonas sp. Marseille-P4361]|uniref:TlpA disulfide reductase family protein n=1 Tax=Dysgonomonas sp. Marseille-P4361 TaxID=2161820 RepID=UPI000D554461|nr:TlpA disulfide reductase family protein [Dysgonomonas sp. Marseille-P4361]